jgi:nitroimidazol reductase NimA-like FMN-containing flavoprotein (pyridoxamine 5'-phosphate oxidase superfamily)
MLARKSRELPENVKNLLSSGRVGHLSTISPNGKISIVPIGFHFDGMDVFFGTPKDSAKRRFMQNNPNVSLVVDNGEVMKDALGVLIQGRAEIYDAKRTLRKFKETVPAIVKFAKKYPDVFLYYTKDLKELPDDRKFYKYRIIRIVTEKMLYWDGYTWGRVLPKPEEPAAFFDINGKEDPKMVAKIVGRVLDVFQSVSFKDVEYEGTIVEYPQELAEADDFTQLDLTWSAVLDQSIKDGEITQEEEALLKTVRNNYLIYTDVLEQTLADGVITKDEHLLLKTVRGSLYKTAFHTALEDGVLTKDEWALLRTLKEKLTLD